MVTSSRQVSVLSRGGGIQAEMACTLPWNCHQPVPFTVPSSPAPALHQSSAHTSILLASALCQGSAPTPTCTVPRQRPPPPTSHSRAQLSAPPVASCFPSRLWMQVWTQVWMQGVMLKYGISAPPVASCFPSWLCVDASEETGIDASGWKQAWEFPQARWRRQGCMWVGLLYMQAACKGRVW